MNGVGKYIKFTYSSLTLCLLAGWVAAARRMRERGEDRLLDPLMSTRFDEEDCGQD